MRIKRLHHIQICIPVGAEEQARQFYTEAVCPKEISITHITQMNRDYICSGLRKKG